VCAGAGRRGHCCPPVGRVQRFLEPWLLLLLARKPSHGYELMERLSREDEMPDADPGLIYPLLRRLEAQGFLRSSWEVQEGGPARRLYEITPEGVEYLRAWAGSVRQIRARLERFLAEYQAQFPENEVKDRG
jgi:PadR family transcriptional regulator PadR